MNTLENLQSLKIIIKNRPVVYAERVSDAMWELSEGPNTRKDRITENALSGWMKDAGAKYEVIKLRPQKITMGIDVDTSELDELNEKMMQLFVTTSMLRSLGVDLTVVSDVAAHTASPVEPASASDAPTPPESVHTIGIDLGTPGDDTCAVWALDKKGNFVGETILFKGDQVIGVTSPNYSFGYAKCTCETCKNTVTVENPDFDMIDTAKSVSILDSDIRYTRSKLAASFIEKKASMFIFDVKNVLEACRGKRVRIVKFPKQEVYDHFAKRYGRLVEDVQESARIAEDLQKQLQNQRDRYTFLDAKRAELHEKMKRLG